MRKIKFLAAPLVIALFGMLLVATPAQALNAGDRCFPLDQGKYSTDDDGVPIKCVCRPSPQRSSGLYCIWEKVNPPRASEVVEWASLNALVGQSETTTTPNGYYRSRGALTNFYNSNASSLPAGYLATSIVVLKWNGTVPGGRWETCLDSGFYYNGVNTYGFTLTWRFTSPPCGNNWYQTRAYNFVYSSGAWQGNGYGLESGFEGWNGCLSCLSSMTSSTTSLGAAPPPGASVPKIDVPRVTPDKARNPAPQPGLTAKAG